MVSIPNYFSFHTWLKHVMVKCTVCGESFNFKTTAEKVHLLSEITEWAEFHWETKHSGVSSGNSDSDSERH